MKSKLHKHWPLLLVIGIFILLRIAGLNDLLISDEHAWIHAVEDLLNGVEKPYMLPHGPLSTILYWIPMRLFGFSELGVRLMPFMFALGTLLFTYKIGAEYFNKKTGVLASLLVAVSALHVMVSTQVDIDGAFMTFFMVAAFYYYHRHTQKKDSYVPLLACLFTLTLFKFQGFLIFGYLGLSTVGDILRRRNIQWLHRILIPVIPLALFGVAIIVSNALGYPWFEKSLNHLLKTSGTSHSFVAATSNITKVMVLLSPLVFLFLFGFNKKEFRQSRMVQEVLLVSVVVFGFSIMFVGGALERYLSPMIPFLCLAGAFALYDFNPKKHQTFFFGSIAILLVAVFTIELLTHNYVTMYPTSESLVPAFQSLDFTFKVPITGSSGPVGFYITFLNVLLTGALFGLSLVSYYIVPKNLKYVPLIIGIASALAFNAVVIEENQLALINQDVPAAYAAVQGYLIENPMPEPLLVYFKRDYYYLRKHYDQVEYTFSREAKFTFDPPQGSEFTIAWIDFTKASKDHPMLQFMANNDCNLHKDFSDSKGPLAQIHVCTRS